MTHVQNHGLTIVPAGAGAGKTHQIKTTLSAWVKGNLVSPERILAVTFTEAAASELRERIRAGLLAEGLVNQALAVERAYVSTIHGLGLRLLTEHALAAGASPQPRHLGDAERDLLIRQALAQAKALDPIKNDPERFGYKPNWQKGSTVEDALRGKVLAMIDLLRGLGEKGSDPSLIAPALARLETVYGSALETPQAAQDALHGAILAMLDKFPDGGVGKISAKGPKEALEKDLALFQRVRADPTLLDRDWGLWQSLRGLFTSNTQSKTPPPYDDLAHAIIAAAEVVQHHPGPLADAKLHFSCLVACAQEVMQTYEARKKALGLIDYADMISGAEKLLRENPSVRQAVLDEIGCVIIDEFQDTNPVQFALLWQLGAHAPRTLLVGDVKQSIMGFQGADPRLSEALANARPDATQPLEKNWRSTPAVMEFVNALGRGLFGLKYNPLEPTRPAVAGPALEILQITRGRRVRNHSTPPEHIAERITTLLNSAETVIDRHNDLPRRVRPSDIALLVCRHATAGRYAEELRARGVPVRISEDGWATSNVIQAARAALFYAANPADAHAGLLLRTIGPDPLPLQTALTRQIEGTLADDSILMRLAGISDQVARLSVAAGLDLVLNAAGLRTWADRQADAPQPRADLLRLEAEAEAFGQAHRDLKAASGFHGETAKVFLGWLDARANDRDFDRHPDPSADSAEAVEIVTWHASKGREWPITVVAEFDDDIEERAGSTATQFDALDRIDDMAVVLGSAQLIHTPTFHAPEAQRRFIENRRPAFEATGRNLLYVALTRARDRLILEWPAFVKERDKETPGASCLFHILKDACRPVVGENSLTIGTTDCAAKIVKVPDTAAMTPLNGDVQLGQTPRLGEAEPAASVGLTPWRIQPSQALGGVAPSSRNIRLGDAWPVLPNTAARGTALHLALRTYLIRPDLADRLPAATGLDGDTLQRTAQRAVALQSWLRDEGFSDLRCEVPFVSHTPQGAEIAGVIDLLALGKDGALLVDHKTGGQAQGLGPYWAQLESYAALMPALFPDHPLRGVMIHWVDHGTLELVELEKGLRAFA